MKILRLETYQGIRTKSGIERFFSMENPAHNHRKLQLNLYKDLGVEMRLDDRIYLIAFANIAFVEMVEEKQEKESKKASK